MSWIAPCLKKQVKRNTIFFQNQEPDIIRRLKSIFWIQMHFKMIRTHIGTISIKMENLFLIQKALIVIENKLLREL
jgi:hypothetical protein